ncbi:MAG: rod-binding protein [Bdellovibrionales bacterium]
MIKKVAGIPIQNQNPGEIQKPSSGNPQLDAQFQEVAQMYEKQFLREMMRTMRSTVQDSGLVKVSQGEKIFREQLDHEYVEKWGDKGGIGLSDMIYEQLLFHYGPKKNIDKPQGPIPLDEKSSFGISRSSKTPSGVAFEFKLPDGVLNQQPVPLTVPWDGLITQKLSLGPDETFLEILHDNGAKSRFSFTGVLDPREIGEKVQSGQGLGYLSPKTKNFVWNVSL